MLLGKVSHDIEGSRIRDLIEKQVLVVPVAVKSSSVVGRTDFTKGTFRPVRSRPVTDCVFQ